jgi:hypothetical protein
LRQNKDAEAWEFDRGDAAFEDKVGYQLNAGFRSLSVSTSTARQTAKRDASDGRRRSVDQLADVGR